MEDLLYFILIALFVLLLIILMCQDKLGFTSKYQYEGADVQYVPIHAMPAVRTEGSTMMVPDSYTWGDRRLRPKNDI